MTGYKCEMNVFIKRINEFVQASQNGMLTDMAKW